MRCRKGKWTWELDLEVRDEAVGPHFRPFLEALCWDRSFKRCRRLLLDADTGVQVEYEFHRRSEA